MLLHFVYVVRFTVNKLFLDEQSFYTQFCCNANTSHTVHTLKKLNELLSYGDNLGLFLTNPASDQCQQVM